MDFAEFFHLLIETHFLIPVFGADMSCANSVANAGGDVRGFVFKPEPARLLLHLLLHYQIIVFLSNFLNFESLISNLDVKLFVFLFS